MTGSTVGLSLDALSLDRLSLETLSPSEADVLSDDEVDALSLAVQDEVEALSLDVAVHDEVDDDDDCGVMVGSVGGGVVVS